MNINKKLLSGFSIVLVLLGIIASIAVYQLSAINATYSNLLDTRVKRMIMVEKLRYLSTEQVRSIRGYLLTGEDSSIQDYEQAKKKFTEISLELRNSTDQEKVRSILQELDKTNAEYADISEQLIAFKKQNNTQEFVRLIKEKGNPIGKTFIQKTNELETFQTELLNKNIAQIEEKVAHIKNIVILISILAFLVGSVIAYLIGRILSRPIIRVAEAAKQIAEGNLSLPDVVVQNKDEVGEMATLFNQMKGNLRNLIHKVGESSKKVAASSEELYASSEQAAQTANQMASTMQEIATGADIQMKSTEENKKAMEEGAIALQRIAESASTAAESSIQVLQQAKQGNQIINQTIQQMETINSSVQQSSTVMKDLEDSSIKIGHIVEVIGDIASQTNLLALNAAIEAARAGEHGKGFAVVADEVRKLAEQSRQSSEQVGELIKEIQQNTTHSIDVMGRGAKEVEAGAVIVNKAGEAFQQILHSIQQITEQVQEVSAATEEVSASTDQMTASMEQLRLISEKISMGTQGTTASSQEQLASMEEVAAAADDLSKLAQELQNEIMRFNV